MAEALVERGTSDVAQQPPHDRDWPPKLWNWKNALIILVLWFAGFIAGNIAQVLVLFAQQGAFAEMAAGNTEFFETMDFVVTFEVQAVTFVSFGIAAIGSVALVNALGPKHSLRNFGFRKMETKWWWWAAGLGLALAGIRIGIGYGLFALFPALEEGAEALAAALILPDPTLIEVLLSVFFLSIFVPIYEEVFFRGFLHNWLRNTIPMWGAIVLSSLAFGLIHFIPVQIVTAFLLGVGMAWVYEKSGSLWSAIVLHIVNNGLVAVLTYGALLFT